MSYRIGNWELLWQVDGCSGSTIVKNCSIIDAKAYFKIKFEPFGYISRGIIANT